AVTEADYTTTSWTAYPLVVAENVVTTDNTQAEVDAATSAITTAQGDLVPVSDLTAYNAALAAVTEADYTTTSWTAYQLVVAENVVTTDNTQAEVDAATSAITTAQGDLVPVSDLTAYNAALAAVTEADYTTTSWTAYQLVVAENVVTTDNTQAEVDAATSAITTAQGDLVPVSDLTAYNAALAAVTEADYTTTSWTAPHLWASRLSWLAPDRWVSRGSWLAHYNWASHFIWLAQSFRVSHNLWLAPLYWASRNLWLALQQRASLYHWLRYYNF
ncbi:unnamed protein product, partial [marine sediment metagenome]